MRSRFRLGRRRTFVAFAVLLVAAAGTAGTVTASRGDTHVGAADNWPTFGYDYEATRNVPFDQITPSNVKNLGLAFTVNMAKLAPGIPLGQESYPLKVGNSLYVTTPFDNVFAIDARSGKVQWHFKPSKLGAFKNFGLNTNRGVGYGAGKLYLATLDMRLISINAKTGKLVKQIYIYDTVKDARPEFGYYETMAPIFYKNRVLVGSSGADNGVRGFFMAYTPDLKPAWPAPHWNVPPEGQDWRKLGRFHGGGASWDSPAIDPTTNTAYFTSSNPSPDFFASLRPGPNPKTNSLIAVDLNNGKEKWWRQQLGPDEWDYDTVQTPIVYDAQINGDTRRVVSVGTKEGVWFAYDAASGEPIYERVKVLDRVEHPKLKRGKPVTIYPSTLGGINYATASFSPDLNFMFQPTVESASVLIQAKSASQVDKDRVRGDVDTGAVNGFGSAPKNWHDYGSITAIDLGTGKIAWKTKTPEPERGGVTSTKNGLLFAGGGDGNLRALDARTGKVLWKFQTGAQISSGVTLYMAGGSEYVAVPIGGTFTSSLGGTANKLMVFKLNGSKKQFKAPVTVSKSAAPQARTPAIDYLTLGSAPNTFNAKLNAAQGPAGGGLNFNGYNRGGMTMTVPEGSTVEVTFRNVAVQSPHSAIITSVAGVKQLTGQKPAFPGAQSARPRSGITSGTLYFSFVASKQGTYALICGVAGHAIGGQWDYFVVGPKGSKATLKLGSKVYDVTKSGPKLRH
jgi:PQQ-dependent dehydrogenase (methanol/ethanol family)